MTNSNVPKKMSDMVSLIQKPAVVLAEVVTGALSTAADPSKGALVVGRLVQSIIKCDFYTQLGTELTKLREEGKIAEDYLGTNQDKANLTELLQAVDEGVTEEVYKAMRMIFIRSIYIDAEEGDKMLAYQLLTIARGLSSAEVLLLSACYRIKLTNLSDYGTMTSADTWLVLMAEKTGLRLKELVVIAEDSLIEKKLFTSRRLSDSSGIRQGDVTRLTALGEQLCSQMIND